MISRSFIHEYDQYDDVIQFINNQMTDIGSLMENSLELDRQIEDLKMFNESTDDKKEEKKKVDKSFLDKIGDTVIGLVQKIKKLLDDFKRMINEKIWSRKSDWEKYNAVLSTTKDEALKEKIICAFNSGDLDLRDIKSMQDLTDGTIDLMRKLNLGKIDESEFEKRFNSLYDKYKKYGKPIVEMIGGVAAVTGFVLTVKKFKSDWMKSTVDYAEYSRRNADRWARTVDQLIRDTAGTRGQNAASIQLRAWTQVQTENSKNINGIYRIVNRVADGIERVVGSNDRLTNHATRGMNNLESNADRILRSAEQRENIELDREYRRAMASSQGRIAGEDSMGVPRRH